jgi:hypothetical protein
MYFRPEDHLVMTGLYIEQIQNGTLKVAARIAAKDAVYPPLADFRKEPF